MNEVQRVIKNFGGEDPVLGVSILLDGSKRGDFEETISKLGDGDYATGVAVLETEKAALEDRGSKYCAVDKETGKRLHCSRYLREPESFAKRKAAENSETVDAANELLIIESGRLRKRIEEVHETIGETYEILDRIGGEKFTYDEVLKCIGRSGFRDRIELMAALKKAEESEEESAGEFLVSKRGYPVHSYSKTIPEGERVEKREEPNPELADIKKAMKKRENRANELLEAGKVADFYVGLIVAIAEEEDAA